MRGVETIVLVVMAIACGGGAGGGGADSGASQPVGRVCESSLAVSDPTAITSPALDCVTRQCLHVIDQSLDMCTAACMTDADCMRVPESPCTAGFSCVIALDVGPFACMPTCACNSSIPAGGFAVSCP